ncbi:translation elongation factor EF-G [Dysgonomonas sp. PFB1-18]|uniref:BfmA/BtgA family mobilization protein n=1 Tax=unclassified Dysgonomonas TaxID=2630389 RepID=UPI00247610A1|nr:MULTISPECIES: BfmA/BtgA family mobilization protein [unclassified Dysgonomonas]MDH6311061.1 translation elongation factor EF-G [Dysgonomonas sp. PF1-14]MDH6340999.1 translation elongation factor EF-G [Dysgonomonas sp. PF1-16]MDH6382554.1 translation elongation factor EF-G [Dysgonomonas sp. PFB1-18]MDH6399912.1 translation elongation factor EF-G [Dysgonomonas sp. PF1-23]
MKSIKLQDATYFKLKNRIEEHSEAKSFDNYIRQMLVFFSETGTDPFNIKDVPTVEIKNNTDKLLKEFDRLVKIVKAQERDNNLNRDKQTNQILQGVSTGIVVQEETVSSDIFRDLNNIEATNSQWRQILELAQERCLIVEKQDRIIKDLEKKLSLLQSGIEIPVKSEVVSEYDTVSSALKDLFMEFVNKSQTKSVVFPVCNEVDAADLEKYRSLLMNYSGDMTEDTYDYLKQFFSLYRQKEEKGVTLTLVNRELFEDSVKQVLNTLF